MSKIVREENKVSTNPLQLRQFQIEFIKKNKDLFPLENFNVWVRNNVNNLIEEKGEWKKEYSRD